MKKVLIILSISLFTIMSGTSYAGVYKNRATGNEGYSGQSGALYESSAKNSGRETVNSSGGIYGASSNGPLDGRPGSGGGIGQEAPLGNGLDVLVACCIVFVAVKFFAKKKGSRL